MKVTMRKKSIVLYISLKQTLQISVLGASPLFPLVSFILCDVDNSDYEKEKKKKFYFSGGSMGREQGGWDWGRGPW